MNLTLRAYDDFAEKFMSSHRITSHGITYKLGAVSCAKPHDIVVFSLTGRKVSKSYGFATTYCHMKVWRCYGNDVGDRQIIGAEGLMQHWTDSSSD